MTEHRPADDAAEEAWRRMVDRIRAGEAVPFQDQWRLFQSLEAGRSVAEGPLPVWRPDRGVREQANLAELMRQMGAGDVGELHSWSAAHRADFWRWVVARLGIVFRRPPEATLDSGESVEEVSWLPGARLNVVDSCFLADPDAPAVVLASERSARPRTVSFAELGSLVRRVQGGLQRLGVEPGDGVALYMPMNLECVAAYLAVVRMGAYVVSIADSFSAGELARRVQLGGASTVVTSSSFQRGGRRIDLYAKVREADAPRCVVVAAGGDEPGRIDLRPEDLWWTDLVDGAQAEASVEMEPEAVSNVLFSSGTTGTPKAIPWTHLTPLKCAMDGLLHQDIRVGDVVAWPTNVGWMMGPWLIYAALMNRAAIALYEGIPSGAGFVRFVEDAGVTMLGVVPSLVRAWRQLEDEDAPRWTSVRVFSSTGEPSGREDSLWLMSRTGYGAPVIEYCGGTEIGGGYITGTVLQPASPATFTTPALGLDLVILDEERRPVGEGEVGEVFLVPPSIGLSQRLLNRDHHEVYHAGCPAGPGGEALRRHGDVMARLGGGFYRAHGRADDTMNLGGIKVSSRELEQVADSHDEVRESAAVGVRTGDEGAERLVFFVVGDAGLDCGRVRRELQERIASELNPLFRVHEVIRVDALPRTASNKVMRRALRDRHPELSERDPRGTA